MRNRLLELTKTAQPPRPTPPEETSPWADLPQQWLEELTAYVRKSPAVSLGVALTVGVIVGFWIKRK